MSKLDSILIQIAAAERRLGAKASGLPSKLHVLGLFGGDTPEERREIAMKTTLAPYGGITEQEAVDAGCNIFYNPMAWLNGRYVDKVDPSDIDAVVNSGKSEMDFDPFAGCVENDSKLDTNLDTGGDEPHPARV